MRAYSGAGPWERRKSALVIIAQRFIAGDRSRWKMESHQGLSRTLGGELCGGTDERQRRSILQPRVARHELPWVGGRKQPQPQRGCGHPFFTPSAYGHGHNLVEVVPASSRQAKVGAAAPTLGWRPQRRWRKITILQVCGTASGRKSRSAVPSGTLTAFAPVSPVLKHWAIFETLPLSIVVTQSEK